jgi:hypothetical protein
MPEGYQERWLTYVELGELLRCTPTAARMHAKRRGWPRRSPNMIGDRARVLVPNDLSVQPRATADRRAFVAPMISEPNGEDQARTPNSSAISSAIEALREQLSIANRRIDELIEDRRRDAEARGAERIRIDRLLTELADARAAERISADSAAALRHELDLLRARPWWRRWFR